VSGEYRLNQMTVDLDIGLAGPSLPCPGQVRGSKSQAEVQGQRMKDVPFSAKDSRYQVTCSIVNRQTAASTCTEH